ncbi:hypothetical protein PUN28_015270 [Cardiocondyla obscurior]|uniref:Uncharacterized protein n=1 Tax=Cardiocondyla obscurior TaxID=286306 RepID=A0AAW2F1U3_9HYME
MSLLISKSLYGSTCQITWVPPYWIFAKCVAKCATDHIYRHIQRKPINDSFTGIQEKRLDNRNVIVDALRVKKKYHLPSSSKNEAKKDTKEYLKSLKNFNRKQNDSLIKEYELFANYRYQNRTRNKDTTKSHGPKNKRVTIVYAATIRSIESRGRNC